MIRPFTIVTFMMACGSGLYLYQSKHEVQMLDKTINQAQRDISVLRDQSRLLANDWTMLNDPERLRKFSDMYLSLKPTLPSQYASLADLDARLPPPRSEAPSDTPEDRASATAEPDAAVIEAAPSGVADDTLPLPPMPSAPPPTARPAERKVAAVKPTAADAAPSRLAAPIDPHGTDQHATDPHGTETRAPRQPDHAGDLRPVELHPPAPSPQPLRTAVALPRPLPASPSLPSAPSQTARLAQAGLAQAGPSRQPTPNNGSLLGMARGAASLPAPRPMPVNATNWYNAN